MTGITRQEVSCKLDLMDGSSRKQAAVVDTISEFIWSRLEKNARREDCLHVCTHTATWEYIPCLKPSMRQLDTLQWFLEQVYTSNKEAAFHYINEYVDNYKSGWYTECSEYELQVIWIMLQLMIKT